MKMNVFTKEEVIDRVKEKYDSAICLDMIEGALQQSSIEDAADLIITESMYWNGEW